MTITLDAVRPTKKKSFNVRHGNTTPGSVSQYSAPNFAMHTGQDVQLEFTVRDSAGATVNISTYTTITFQAFPSAGGAAVLDITGTLVSGGVGGIFTVDIADTDTDTEGADVLDIEIQVSGTDMKNTLVKGAKLTLQKAYLQ